MPKEDIFVVKGMTCSACSAAVERVTKRLDGVESAVVNLTTEKLLIQYDEEKVAEEDIIRVVEKAGYKAEKHIELKEIIVPVEGMTCSACSAAVERVVGKLDGVTEINVNINTNNAYISYDGGKLRISQIKNAITKAGYKPLEITKKEVSEVKDEKEKELRRMWFKFRTAIFFTVPLLYVAMGHMVGLPIPGIMNPENHPLIFALTQLILLIPVVLAGSKFYTVGFRTLVAGHPNMDSLIAVGTSSAIVYSLFSTYMIYIGQNHYWMELYFETAATIIALIMLGKTLEHRSKGKTSEAIEKLLDLQPKTAVVLHGKDEVEIPIEEVEVGDIVLVKPGMSIPIDGIVVEGYSSVDESMITGESIPVEKSEGSKAVGASINKNGLLKIKADKVGKDTALSKIIELVEHAQSSKAPIARLADIISGYFVPAVIAIALVSGVIWQLTGGDLSFTLKIFISVLVIACPCALGLATPTAIMVGTGKGAENGILFKSGVALEQAHKIDAIIFDKTGTITEGKPVVTDIELNAIEEEELLAYVVSAEKGSEHPLGEAIVEYGLAKGVEIKDVSDFKAVPGHGIQCLIDGKTIIIGNEKMMKRNAIDISKTDKATEYASEGKTPMFIGINGNYAGIIAVADTIKESSIEAIEKLHKMGLKIAMITGDHKETADAIGRKVGIDFVLSEVLPEDKANEVEKMKAQGRTVAMVGDGINDAPALATADLGMAIGSGTDIAVESADIVLIKNDLRDVASAIKLSHSTIKNIKQNLFWAFIYNIAGIPLAAGLLYVFGGPLLNPMFAAAAMSMSSVSVVTNALRLRNVKI